MIKYISKGDIFESKAEALVNPVDLTGNMKEGLSADFRYEFPENFKFYRDKAIKMETRLGQVDCFEEKDTIIFNFPTKSSWKWESKMEYIEDGLKDLIRQIKKQNVKSIAIPELIQQDWEIVKPILESYLNIEELKDIEFEIYEPIIKFYGRKPIKKTI